MWCNLNQYFLMDTSRKSHAMKLFLWRYARWRHITWAIHTARNMQQFIQHSHAWPNHNPHIRLLFCPCKFTTFTLMLLLIINNWSRLELTSFLSFRDAHKLLSSAVPYTQLPNNWRDPARTRYDVWYYVSKLQFDFLCVVVPDLLCS